MQGEDKALFKRSQDNLAEESEGCGPGGDGRAPVV